MLVVWVWVVVPILLLEVWLLGVLLHLLDILHLQEILLHL